MVQLNWGSVGLCSRSSVHPAHALHDTLPPSGSVVGVAEPKPMAAHAMPTTPAYTMARVSRLERTLDAPLARL